MADENVGEHSSETLTDSKLRNFFGRVAILAANPCNTNL